MNKRLIRMHGTIVKIKVLAFGFICGT